MAPPKGWSVIQERMGEFKRKMDEAVVNVNEDRRRCESPWEVFKINHQRSRYVYESYMNDQISKEVYDYCTEKRMADKNLMAKWRRPGYERLCCLSCIQPRDHNYRTCCACRVPRANRESEVIECVTCGCTGCASGD